MASLASLESLIRDEAHRLRVRAHRTHPGGVRSPRTSTRFATSRSCSRACSITRSTLVPRADQATELGTRRYHGLLVDERSGALNPAKYAQGLARAAVHAPAPASPNTSASSRSHAFRRRLDRPDDARRCAGGGPVHRHQRLHGRGHAGAAPPPDSDRQLHRRHGAAARRSVRARLIPRRRMVFDSKNFLYYFRLTGDRSAAVRRPRRVHAADARIATARAAVILQRGHGRRCFPSWPGRQSTTRGAGTSRSRATRCRMPGGWTRRSTRAATAVTASRWRRILAASWRRRIAGETFDHPLIDAPVSRRFRFDNGGRPWFLPLVGAYYRFRDWLD